MVYRCFSHANSSIVDCQRNRINQALSYLVIETWTLKYYNQFDWKITSLITSLVVCACLYLQLPTNMKGGNRKVAYIDTEGTLYPFEFDIFSSLIGLLPIFSSFIFHSSNILSFTKMKATKCTLMVYVHITENGKQERHLVAIVGNFIMILDVQ